MKIAPALSVLAVALFSASVHADLVFTFSDTGGSTTIQVTGSFDATGFSSSSTTPIPPNGLLATNSPDSLSIKFGTFWGGVGPDYTIFEDVGAEGTRSGSAFFAANPFTLVGLADPLKGFGVVAVPSAFAMPTDLIGEDLNLTGVIGLPMGALGLPSSFTTTMTYPSAAGGAGDSVTWTTAAVPEAGSFLCVGLVSGWMGLRSLRRKRR